MWMIDYIKKVKRQLRDKYGFKPLRGSTKQEPLLNVPDGEYPMIIDENLDYVRIVDGKIHCCNFRKPRKRKK